MKKIYRYSDPQNDDFAGTNIKTKPLRSSYRYIHRNPLWLLGEFVLYRMIAQPLVFVLVKVAFCQHFENRKVLRKIKKQGAYLYINHTNLLLDAYLPCLVCYRKRAHIISGPDTMSIPGLNNILEMLGVIPIGSSVSQKKAMFSCVSERANEGRLITFYPEAHIWPYYTGIRDYHDSSFYFPAKDGLPVYTITNCYQKRPFGKRPKIISYVDGPFFADQSLDIKEKKRALCALCKDTMCERTEKYSDYEYVEYIRE